MASDVPAPLPPATFSSDEKTVVILVSGKPLGQEFPALWLQPPHESPAVKSKRCRPQECDGLCHLHHGSGSMHPRFQFAILRTVTNLCLPTCNETALTSFGELGTGANRRSRFRRTRKRATSRQTAQARGALTMRSSCPDSSSVSRLHRAKEFSSFFTSLAVTGRPITQNIRRNLNTSSRSASRLTWASAATTNWSMPMTTRFCTRTISFFASSAYSSNSRIQRRY